MVEGLRPPEGGGRKALIVRIPPIDKEGPEVTRARMRSSRPPAPTASPFIHPPVAERSRQRLLATQGESLVPVHPRGGNARHAHARGSRGRREGQKIAELALQHSGVRDRSLAQALGGDRAAAKPARRSARGRAPKLADC